MTSNDVTASSEMVWWGWGVADRHRPLPEPARALLEAVLAAPRRDTPPVGRAAVRLPPVSLPAAARAALVAAVGAEWLAGDDDARLGHCRGRSTLDLLRIRSGDGSDAPDAVVAPGDHDEVLAVLAACAAHHVAAVPYGGGTSVVGGLTPDRRGFAGVVAVDLRRLDQLIALDEVSGIATFGPGVRGPRVEELLAARGFTLGHLPQSFEHASIGGFAATRSSGQASAGYGRFDAMVVALRIATPAGTWELGRAPASAAGPDLRQLVLGSEGAFGVITAVTVGIRPLPEVTEYEGWRVVDFARATDVLRDLAARGALPTVARVSDETETVVGLAGADPASDGSAPGTDARQGGCLVVTGFAGTAAEVAARRGIVGDTLRAAGAVPLGPGPGESWARGRFDAPYLRDALLDVGMVAETLETAGFFSALPGLYRGVREALTAALTVPPGGPAPLVMCHVSHVYRTGASLYFTVVFPAGGDPVASWRSAKAAATDAVMAAGGTLTHHHAVGADHRPWLTAEVGPLGTRVLRAVKDVLDPAGICNPGILIP
jgi:alkyldihydroxyacetonephosphate synthase